MKDPRPLPTAAAFLSTAHCTVPAGADTPPHPLDAGGRLGSWEQVAGLFPLFPSICLSDCCSPQVHVC